jgi:hypothetical protein
VFGGSEAFARGRFVRKDEDMDIDGLADEDLARLEQRLTLSASRSTGQ